MRFTKSVRRDAHSPSNVLTLFFNVSQISYIKIIHTIDFSQRFTIIRRLTMVEIITLMQPGSLNSATVTRNLAGLLVSIPEK